MRHRLVLLFGLAACAGAPAPQPDPAPPVSSDASAASAQEALAPARALVNEGRPREALAELDLVHKARPDDREAWVLRARACLDAAATDTQPQFYFEDALLAIDKAQALGPDPQLDFDAAYAARMLSRPEQAAVYAARAERDVKSPSPAQERVLIEVAFDRYIQAQQASSDKAPVLQSDVEARLINRLARDRGDTWALNQLANLFLWAQRPEASVDVLGQLVRATPQDESAHVRFVQLMRSVEGSESVVSFYERLRAEGVAPALSAWFEASELFELGLQDLAAKRDAVERFVRAEELFLACREANRDYQASCLGYEVMCRAGVGWSLFHAGDSTGAEQAFLATEDLLKGGIEWQIEGRVASGFTGLMYLADRAYRKATSEFDYLANGEAARLYALLHAFRPQDAEIANNAGFFHRDTGVPMLMHARQLRAEAAAEPSPLTPQERAERRARADELERRGREEVAASCAAYKACADLAPDNVAWVNSYALMLVYHYPSRLGEAERLLLHCVEQGERQSADEQSPADVRDAVTESWGDACQNLGMIELVHRRDPAKALEWFQRSYDIGPRPRIERGWVKQVAMRWCERVAAGEELDLEELDPRIHLLE